MALVRRVIVCGLALFTAGCGPRVRFGSLPPNASVYVDGVPVGTTPLEFRTQDARPFSYRIEKPGYTPASGRVETRWGPGRLTGAIFTFGILALFMPVHEFTPEIVNVDLGPRRPQ